ncbi:MAG TPA: hypothetical protein VFQ47_08165 [Nitrososphaera sp.]|jgi:hypothetical protein|nr:hypothetical protein [Nitrososphaera sp.]
MKVFDFCGFYDIFRWVGSPLSSYLLSVSRLKEGPHMITTKSQRLFWILLAILLVGALGFNNSLSQSGEDTNSQLPTGNWTVSAHPYFGPDHLDIPVVVFSVTAAELKRGAVTEVGLLNRSSKPVDAVKLGWIVTKEENQDTILLQGETRFLNIQSGLSVNQKQVLKFPVVTFAKIYKPLLKRGPLEGEFRIEIVVNGILYSDGTTWARSERRKVEFVKAANHINRPTV